MPRDITEVLKKVQRIQIVANRQVDELLAGQYASVFKGRGMEFEEVREYTPGDEVRDIDWNVTARAGRPYVKRYGEERELTVLFVVDVSASGLFGTTDRSKLELLIELAAVLMVSAMKNNDKVGLCLFADRVRQYLPPRKGRTAVLRLLRELVAAEPVRAETRLETALTFLLQVLRRRAVIFLLSDFQGEGFEQALRLLNHRHDVVALVARDRREVELPPVGFLRLEDPETGEVVEVDTRHPRVRSLFSARAASIRRGLAAALRRARVDELEVRTDADYVASLRRFFHMRERRFR